MRALLRLLSLTILFALPLSSALAATAYVHDLKGTLTASIGSGPARPLKMGDTFDAGVTLATSKDSTAVVKFEDGQVVTLSPDTRFAVQEYNYNKKSVKDSNMVFALLQGGLRFVTGVIGATDNNKFKLAVGTATIGVRGTDGWASYVEGVILAAVNQGALSFTSPQGVQAIPAGSSAVAAVSSTGVPVVVVAPTVGISQAMVQRGVAPAVVNRTAANVAVAAQINNVQIPINTPVVVAAAAQAAQVVGTARVAQALARAAANNLAAATTDAEKAAATAAKQAADAAAAKATALATAAIATAQAAATQALNAAMSAGAVPSTPPPPAPAATPLSAVVPSLTTAQVQAQATVLQTSVATQTTALQTTQATLGLPVTSTATIQNAAPVPDAPALPVIPIYVPPPAPTTPVSPS